MKRVCETDLKSIVNSLKIPLHRSKLSVFTHLQQQKTKRQQPLNTNNGKQFE